MTIRYRTVMVAPQPENESPDGGDGSAPSLGRNSARRLSAADWARAALTAIGEGGLGAVAVEPLAARLHAERLQEAEPRPRPRHPAPSLADRQIPGEVAKVMPPVGVRVQLPMSFTCLFRQMLRQMVDSKR